MWGYAEGNATAIGIVVAIIGLAAVGYVGRRLWRKGR
jgi:biopolymer transport protein ExbB/TolQ